MSRFLLVFTLAALVVVSSVAMTNASQPFPQAPATHSWLPHGYGLTMYVDNTVFTRQKALHGFRPSPQYIGSWGQPLWGWDVNGYYRGPQVPTVDPVDCQLPIGLIYPQNTPPMPPIRK